MDKIKKLLLINIPTSICNFRCHYCYLAQLGKEYQGKQAVMRCTPEEVKRALSVERVGGPALINFCAEGETLLTKDIDLYIKGLVENGHYAEIVSNMTITPMINRFLEWDKELLDRVEFKCSFHYLELKKHNLLDVYAENVKKVWKAGASICVEATPSDELIPFIDEMKEFSIKNFGALPHISVARDESTRDIVNLTSLPNEEYSNIWSQFNSDFWTFKKRIFGLKQKGFCYAGVWSYFINLATGDVKNCYYGRRIGNIYDNLDSPLPSAPIAKCPIAHCFNGHALLTLGVIPEEVPDETYGTIRNRKTEAGTQWMQEDLRRFFDSRLSESNSEYNSFEKEKYRLISDFYRGRRALWRAVRRMTE